MYRVDVYLPAIARIASYHYATRAEACSAAEAFHKQGYASDVVG